MNNIMLLVVCITLIVSAGLVVLLFRHRSEVRQHRHLMQEANGVATAAMFRKAQRWQIMILKMKGNVKVKSVQLSM